MSRLLKRRVRPERDSPIDLNEFWEGVLDVSTSAAIEEKLSGASEEEVEQVLAKLPDAVADAVQSCGQHWADELIRDIPRMSQERAAMRDEYTGMIDVAWSDAFDLYTAVIVAATEASADFIRRHSKRDEDSDQLLIVMIELHGRACRIASEILVLMRAGYAEAAIARWRVMHEINVIAMFLKTHGAGMAERYSDHEAVESWRAMKEFQTHAKAANLEPFSQQEVDESRAAFDEALRVYGDRFGLSYGWAATEFPGRFGIKDLEASVELDHLRPWYRFASHQTHGNPKGMIGHRIRTGQSERVLVGPTILGHGEPGQLACITLANITIAFLTTRPEVSTAFISTAILELSARAQKAFVDAHVAVEANYVAPSPDEEI